MTGRGLRCRLPAGAAAVLLLSACSVLSHAAYPPGRAGAAVSQPAAGQAAAPGPLPARTGSYWGVFEPGVPASSQPVQQLAAVTGEAPRIELYFSSWGEPFQAGFARAAFDRGALALVQIEPRQVNLAAVAAGDLDGYLRSFAGQVRAFGEPVIIGFAHEMNGPWYPWGFGHDSPATWVAAWRHVVTVFRQQHADNVTWLWTVNIIAPGIPPPGPWWPGGAYVTWVGIDGYYYEPDDTFAGVFGPTIAAVRRLTSKPVLVAETGIAPGAVPGAMPGLIAGINQYRLLGLVWFDAGGIPDWRLEGHPAAIAAFRQGIAAMLAASRAAAPPGGEQNPAAAGPAGPGPPP
jgi:hypothetical protein